MLKADVLKYMDSVIESLPETVSKPRLYCARKCKRILGKMKTYKGYTIKYI